MSQKLTAPSTEWSYQSPQGRRIPPLQRKKSRKNTVTICVEEEGAQYLGSLLLGMLAASEGNIRSWALGWGAKVLVKSWTPARKVNGTGWLSQGLQLGLETSQSLRPHGVAPDASAPPVWQEPVWIVSENTILASNYFYKPFCKYDVKHTTKKKKKKTTRRINWQDGMNENWENQTLAMTQNMAMCGTNFKIIILTIFKKMKDKIDNFGRQLETTKRKPNGD